MERIRGLMEYFGRLKKQRVKFAKWLLEKLLTSFLISVFIFYGSFLGLQLHQSSFQTVYSVVTSLSVLAYVLSVVLIPSPKEKEDKGEDKRVALIDQSIDFLFPQEVIRYQSPIQVKYGDDFYNLYMTNLRLIAYKRSGLLSKEDEIVAERLEDIQTMSYREKGILSKKGTLRIETQGKKMDFEGKANDIKKVWRETQQCIRRAEAIPTPEAMPKETMILHFCPYCEAKLVPEAKFCNSCGKKLRFG